MYKIAQFLLAMLLAIPWLQGQAVQQVTLEECYAWTNQNYPLAKQMDLIERSTDFNLKNAAKGSLPQISIKGQITYQSDVTSLPVEVPGFEVPTIDKDQYNIFAEIYQPLTNRAHIRTRQQQITLEGALEKQDNEIQLYQLRERINQLYFGILLIDGQIEQLDLLEADLQSAIEKTAAAIVNGTAIENNRRLLEAELINVGQKKAEQSLNRMAFVQMLTAFTGQQLTNTTVFEVPKMQVWATTINRPEIESFMLRENALDIQHRAINNRIIPDLGLFLQAGYGRPALNFLSNEFDTYYVGGLKLNWNLSKLYTSKRERETLQLSRQKIANERAAFLLNTNTSLTQQQAEAAKYSALIEADEELIAIRTSVKESAAVQLESGLITALDYVTYVNAESRARRDLALHQTQLLLAQYQLKTIAGN